VHTAGFEDALRRQTMPQQMLLFTCTGSPSRVREEE
jgi:hypothetical protein